MSSARTATPRRGRHDRSPRPRDTDHEIMKSNAANIVKRNQRKSVHDFSGTYKILEGYCKKQSTKGKWQKRWFVAQDHYLLYKSTAKSKKVLGSIDLLEVGSIKKDDSINGFTLNLHNRVYKLQLTKSSPLADEWVQGLIARQSFKETAVGAAQVALEEAKAAAATSAAAAAAAAAGTMAVDYIDEGKIELDSIAIEEGNDSDTQRLSTTRLSSTDRPPSPTKTNHKEGEDVPVDHRDEDEAGTGSVMKANNEQCCVVS